MKAFAVVILNFNGRSLLERFLPAVIEHSRDAQIYVIDNCSKDDSLYWLKQHYSEQIETIELDQNYGFADGYNRGLQQVKEAFWCLLNSDVRVSKNYYQRPLELLRTFSKIAAVQPKILSERAPDYFEYAGAGGGYIDGLGYPFCRGRLFQSIEKDLGQYNDERQVFWATGACMFIKKEVFDAIGGFDASYFAHQEEIDLCWRAHHKGYQVWYTSQSTVYHLGGSTLSNTNPFKTYLNFRNSLYSLFKNLTSRELLMILFIRLLLDGVAGLLFLLQARPLHTLAILKAHFKFYSQLRTLVEKRRKHQPLKVNRKPFSIVLHYFVLGRKKISI